MNPDGSTFRGGGLHLGGLGRPPTETRKAGGTHPTGMHSCLLKMFCFCNHIQTFNKISFISSLFIMVFFAILIKFDTCH